MFDERFVADFLGETNFVAAQVIGRDGRCAVLETAAGTLHAAVFPDDLPDRGTVTCSIRPEALRLNSPNGAEDGSAPNCFRARRAGVVYLGEMAQHHLTVGESVRLKAFELNPKLADSDGTDLSVSVDPQDVVVLTD